MTDAGRFLEHEVIGGVNVLRLRMSRLDDAAPLHALEAKLFQILEQDEQGTKVLLNLAAVEYLVTTALAKLMSLRAKITNRKGKLCLCCLQPAVMEVMHITQFDTLFPIYGTEQDALKELKQEPKDGPASPKKK